MKKNTVKIAMEISGSGGGFKKIFRGEIDIANALCPFWNLSIIDISRCN